MRARLLPLDGSPPVEIVKDLTVVGRKEQCDLRPDHKSVSKMHCVLVKTDGLLLLRDLGSTNGTRVNNQRVRRAALLPNDQLTIANFKFKVYLGPDEEPSPCEDLQTQNLDAEDISKLLEQARARQNGHGDDDDMPRAVQRNQLPDAYDD